MSSCDPRYQRDPLFRASSRRRVTLAWFVATNTMSLPDQDPTADTHGRKVEAQLVRRRFERYCWWYSSALYTVDADVISVTIGLGNRPDASRSCCDFRAVASCWGV